MDDDVDAAWRGRNNRRHRADRHSDRACWLRLFGVLPFDYDQLSIAELEPGRRFHEESTMLSMRRWRHERTVTPEGDTKTIVRDRITFQTCAALGFAAPLIAAVLRALFGHRHRRLQQHFAEREWRTSCSAVLRLGIALQPLEVLGVRPLHRQRITGAAMPSNPDGCHVRECRSGGIGCGVIPFVRRLHREWPLGHPHDEAAIGYEFDDLIGVGQLPAQEGGPERELRSQRDRTRCFDRTLSTST